MAKKNILLVEPPKSRKYHTQYPPLGLLKIASYHKQRGDSVTLVAGLEDVGFKPDLVYITSLFTYAWEPVHETIRFCKKKYSKSKIIVGGIYASLCKEHLSKSFRNRIEVHEGLFHEAEELEPDYSLVPHWNASIVFSSRGCIRNCSFCAVKQLEPKFQPRKSIKKLIYHNHKKIIFWDNNILASPYLVNILDELEELNLAVDFNQGIDARLITASIVKRLKKLNIPMIRLAYDTTEVGNSLKEAIDILKQAGYSSRRILVYCLYNFPRPEDTPETFLSRMKDLMEWEVVGYPMRYEPLEPRQKNTFISPHWNPELLNMIPMARRVIGFGGAFPPYEGLIKKITKAKNFVEAFKLRAKKV
jgi:hypothetical protein